MTKSTKDYGTLLEWARETAGPKSSGIHELADAVDDLLSRLPVVPVPVYEYGVAMYGELDSVGDTFHSAREAGQWSEPGDGDFVARRVKAGSWELVEGECHPALTESKEN